MNKLKTFLFGLFSLLLLCSFANAADIVYCVDGANNASVDGNYTNQSGLYGGCIFYLQDGGNVNLRLEGDNWTLIDGGYGMWMYYHPIDNNTDEGGECLINDSWAWLPLADGSEPAPTVTYGVCGVVTTTTTTVTTTSTTLPPCIGNEETRCIDVDNEFDCLNTYVDYAGDGDPVGWSQCIWFEDACIFDAVYCDNETILPPSTSTTITTSTTVTTTTLAPSPTIYNSDINWTYLAGIITGSAIILGAILVVIIAIVPILVVLALVSFVVGLYSAILDHVEKII